MLASLRDHPFAKAVTNDKTKAYLNVGLFVFINLVGRFLFEFILDEELLDFII